MSAMDDELYREYILEHYKHPHNFGELPEPDLQFEDSNPLCGDELRMQLSVHDGRVQDVRFSGQGCAISQASASMLTDEIKGKTIEEVMALDRDFVLDLLGIPISATRMKCALLSLKVVKSAGLGAAAAWPDDRAPGDAGTAPASSDSAAPRAPGTAPGDADSVTMKS